MNEGGAPINLICFAPCVSLSKNMLNEHLFSLCQRCYQTTGPLQFATAPCRVALLLFHMALLCPGLRGRSVRRASGEALMSIISVRQADRLKGPFKQLKPNPGLSEVSSRQAMEAVLTWLVERASSTYNLFHRSFEFRDGKTPYSRHHSREWRVSLPPSGETVAFLKRGYKFEQRWQSGIFLESRIPQQNRL